MSMTRVVPASLSVAGVGAVMGGTVLYVILSLVALIAMLLAARSLRLRAQR
ncbi:hypothetical protein EV193_110164 [Herbihabitans rhizosphaerae]|uniref:Uncharacterized protein n=1 Tax=Herbihabitans rhizosphaerae TaxID=1872711 RepID=A0A4Q7KHJ6_9PSEU|nr:hypothetical protein EV193_110164 [Herbihabitans rhizosphaerae]